MPTEKELRRFLDFLKAARPTVDPPAFFASRVAARAVSEGPALFLSIQRAARQLFPAFATLILAVGFLLFQAEAPREVALPEADLLVETPEQATEITVDFVLSDLGDPLSDGSQR